jgi:two-component sensor histidine kinase
METRAAPFRIPDGTMVQLAVTRDISERKRAEAQRTLLINELNHRVKNTLATVQAIAAQTMRGAPAGATLRQRFESRLIALSEAHSILTQENWEGAEIRQIIALALHAHAGTDRALIEGPPIRLSPKAAVAIAMGMHELATNAVNYGALSSQAGRVDVSWQIGEAEPAEFALQWRESGGPPVAKPSARGFGSRLIEHNLAYDLDGEARIDYRPEGLICSITSPLAALRSAQGR